MDQSWLPAELREAYPSFIGTVVSIAKNGFRNSGPKGPESEKLLEAVHFSKRLISTYNVLIMAAILLVAIGHLYTKSARRRQICVIKSAVNSSPQTSSSASSTLIEDISLEQKDTAQNEQTSLLHSRSSTGVQHTSFVTRLRARCEALWMYQPKPKPALTASSNQLPSNGTSFLVVIFFLVNLFYLFYNIPQSLAGIFVLTDRASLCFVANIPILYLLGAKNNQPIEWLTGWTYEKLNIYHRRLGEWMILLGILHTSGMFMVWYAIIRPQGYSLAWFLSRRVIAIGLAAIISYIGIWGTSIGYFREKAYELFLASHIFLQLAALIMLFFHAHIARPFTGAALAIWALDRLIARISVSSRKFVATLEIAEDKETVLMYCDIVLDKSKRGDIRSGWKAGQHVFLSVPAMRWHHAYQAHPFTIGSPAPTTSVDGGVWPLELIIRAKDGFSKELLEYAKFHQHVQVYLDGPYGSSELEEAVLCADRVCFVAGGSGITVTYPLAWSLWSRDREAKIISSRTVYHQGKKQKPNIRLHSPQSTDRRAHLWVRKSPTHKDWIRMFPSYQMAASATQDGSTCFNGVDLVGQAFDTRLDDRARPDIATEVRMWLQNGNMKDPDHTQRICLIVSGPDGLVRDVRNCAANLVKDGYNIELHVEKFGW